MSLKSINLFQFLLQIQTVLSQPDPRELSRDHLLLEMSNVLDLSFQTDSLGTSLLNSPKSYSIETSEQDLLGTSLEILRAPVKLDSGHDVTASLHVPSPLLDNKDVLGTSLLDLSDQSSHLDLDQDSLGTSKACLTTNSSPASDDRSFLLTDNSLDTCIIDDSYFEHHDDERLSELIDTIRGPRFTSTPSKVCKELQFDRVQAKQRPDKPLSKYLTSKYIIN